MKIGFSTVIFESTGLPLSRVVRKASNYGYDGIELNFQGLPPEIDVGKIKSLLRTYNVEIAAIGTRYMFVKHKYIHLADNNRLAPGFGHINFVAILKALREVGYNGYLVMEFIPKPDVDEALQKALSYIRTIM
jgi:sugar phosphate isomerase/epimerase